MFWKRGKLTKKTSEYEAYQNEIRDELIGTTWTFGKELVSVHVEVGLSSRAADLDNIIKPLLDTLQGIYEEFNDNKVNYIELHKEIVSKGDEYIWLRIREYTEGLYPREESPEEETGRSEDKIKAT